MPRPVLTTERLRLEPLTADHTERGRHDRRRRRGAAVPHRPRAAARRGRRAVAAAHDRPGARRPGPRLLGGVRRRGAGRLVVPDPPRRHPRRGGTGHRRGWATGCCATAWGRGYATEGAAAPARARLRRARPRAGARGDDGREHPVARRCWSGSACTPCRPRSASGRTRCRAGSRARWSTCSPTATGGCADPAPDAGWSPVALTSAATGRRTSWSLHARPCGSTRCARGRGAAASWSTYAATCSRS